MKRTCSVQGCDRPHHAKGDCIMHYKRRREGRPLDAPLSLSDNDTGTCSIDGCGRPVAGRGWCGLHWQRWKRHGDPMVKNRPRPPRPPCSIDGCDEAAFGRGWCQTHYGRWYRLGDPLAATVYSQTEEERFFAKVDKGGPGGCWLWTGSNNGRYPVFPKGGHYAHRWSYEHHVGPIPDGQEVDHLCRVTLCVNPAHLEAVTPAENKRRARMAV